LLVHLACKAANQLGNHAQTPFQPYGRKGVCVLGKDKPVAGGAFFVVEVVEKLIQL
jgi:hypothetical protein